MSPFQFPDPSVQSTVVNADTGDIWIFEDGVWMIADPQDPDTPVTPGVPPTGNDLVAALQLEIAALRSDIIDLRAQLTAASVNNFLILE